MESKTPNLREQASARLIVDAKRNYQCINVGKYKVMKHKEYY